MNRKINRKDESDGNGRGDRQMRRAKKKGTIRWDTQGINKSCSGLHTIACPWSFQLRCQGRGVRGEGERKV
jgi:hypothetical protein